MFTQLLGGETAQTKRRLYPTCVCYHGCVTARNEALTFRELAGDIKSQVRSLQRAGYQIIPPSQYKAWQTGTLSFDKPVTCLHFDDCLGSIDQIIPWLIAQGIPCGIALITRRLGKYDPEDGFARWETVRDWVATGLVELLSHTHNMHHLTLIKNEDTGVLDVGPILEAPCWVDDGDVVYRVAGDTRWYWDFSHVDAITLGVPLFGTDPWDSTTPITTTLTITPKASGTVTLLRLWMALSKPSGSGYNAQVQIRANGALVFDGVIAPKHYETRDQWVEREFLTITLDAAFAITSGTAVQLQFTTLNAGTGCALLYGICTADDAAFRAVTNCQGLYPEGSQAGPYRYWKYIDYPAGQRWPVLPCLILGFGTGRHATVTEYQAYVDADCAQAQASVTSCLGAQWAEAIAFAAPPLNTLGSWVIEGWNYIPVGWAAPNRVAAIVPISSAAPTLVEWLRFKFGNAEYFRGGDGFGTDWANPAYAEAQTRSYPATFTLDFSTDQATWTPIGQAAIWRIAKGRGIDVTPFTLSGTGYLRITPINGGPFGIPDARCRWGVASVTVGYRTTTGAAPALTQLVYPFGAYLGGDSAIVQQRPGFKDISPDLKSVLQANNITHGYTIQAVRNVQAGEVREPDLRQTEYALGRWLVYGDQDPRVAINNLAATSGYLLPDVKHRGVKWQVSMEADIVGNATIRQRVDVLDFVAFDAWYFDGSGNVVPNDCNDGGTYDGTTYPDDRAWLRARGVRCLLIINNNAGTGEPDPATGEHVVNNPGLYIPAVVAAATGWDGITCNLEALPATARAAATSFYTQLATALHAAEKLLHATVPATTGTDYDAPWWVGWCDHLALAKVCDGIKVMSYTETGPGTDPGPAAPQWFWDQAYDYIRCVVPEPYWPRVYCGCRAFGHLWSAGDAANADYQTYHQTIAAALTYGKQIEVRDTEMGWGNGTYTGWCGTPATLDRSQLEAAKSGFGGIGLWKLDDGDLEEFFPTTKQIGLDNMAAFVEQRFPVEYSWGAEGGPKFRTQVVTSDSGAESRVQTWQFPLCSYKLTRDLFSAADHDKLLAFWRIMGGRATGFRFKDFMDFRATGQNIGTGDGLTATFQLRKAYTFADNLTGVSQTLWRIIKKPVPGTVSISVDGVLKTSGWTINTSTGLVSFTVAPASGAIITSSFEFDVPVRFSSDDLRVVVDKSYNTYSWSSMGFDEVRL